MSGVDAVSNVRSSGGVSFWISGCGLVWKTWFELHDCLGVVGMVLSAGLGQRVAVCGYERGVRVGG